MSGVWVCVVMVSVRQGRVTRGRQAYIGNEQHVVGLNPVEQLNGKRDGFIAVAAHNDHVFAADRRGGGEPAGLFRDAGGQAIDRAQRQADSFDQVLQLGDGVQLGEVELVQGLVSLAEGADGHGDAAARVRGVVAVGGLVGLELSTY